MKSTQLAILFAVLASLAVCQNALKGLSGFDIKSGPENSDCFFRVYVFPASDHVTIEQQYRPINVQPAQPLPEGCTAKPFSFDSLFINEDLTDQLSVIPPTNATNPVFDVSFGADALYSHNGTACVLLPQTERAGLDQYLCRLIYAGVPLYFAVWGTGNFTFDTSDSSVSAFVYNRQNTKSLYVHALIIAANTSFPAISVGLYDACGSTSNVITSLSSAVTVTTATDLSAQLPGTWLAYTIIKRLTSTAPGDYLVIPSASNATLFDAASTNGCWSLGFNYSSLLSDMAYCAGGCKVSFVMMNANYELYVMETTGIQTIDSSVGGGNGNGTGSGNGNGSGSGNGNGNGNGNVGVVSSAASMAFNACLLLISFAYLAWL